MTYTSSEITQLNEFNNLISFKVTEQYRLLMNSKARYNLMLSGNQGGKTSSVARHYVDRFLGLHPIAEKNSDYFVCKNDHTQAIVTAPPGSMNGEGRCRTCDEPLELYCEPPHLRIYRFASHNLPGTSGGEQEVRNTQYPEFKKWLPNYLIRKDINSRSPVLYVMDVNGGADILAEFVSYGQDVQATAGPQRKGLWADEESPYDFMEEQYPRLLAANGDIVFSMTAASKISWMYDEYYEKASIIRRTDNVVNAPVMKELFGEQQKVEFRKTGKDICVVQFATDDNPTLKKEAIEELFANIDDKATMARRRYGGFAQASGRVLKSYNQAVHYQPMQKFFPDGIPAKWIHARGIDYHQRNDWYYLAVSLSSQDELFVWKELRLPPDSMTNYDMAERMALATHQRYRFMLNKIDPLANTIQGNTGFTTVEDLNKHFSDLKKEEIGNGGYWDAWDTRSTLGREKLKERLKNANKCRVPFNNQVMGPKGWTQLPTIWIMDTCPLAAQYLRMWRYEEHKGRDATATRDDNESVQQKWSHFPMVLEGILKEKSFKPKIGERMIRDRNHTARH